MSLSRTDLALAENTARRYRDEDMAAALLAEHKEGRLILRIPGRTTTVETTKRHSVYQGSTSSRLIFTWHMDRHVWRSWELEADWHNWEIRLGDHMLR